MNSDDRKVVADQLEAFAKDVANNRADWVWIAVKYKDGMRLTYATPKAPKRPQGFT